MQYPKLTELNSNRQIVDSFRGYNHNLRIADGEFFDMQNMTSDLAPVLAPRGRRGIYASPAAPAGLIAKDSLCYMNQAKRIQKGITLSNAVNNADFQKYSGYVSSEHTDKLLGFIPVKDEDITYEYINATLEDRSIMEQTYRNYLLEYVIKPGYGRLNEQETSIYNYYYQKPLYRR